MGRKAHRVSQRQPGRRNLSYRATRFFVFILKSISGDASHIQLFVNNDTEDSTHSFHGKIAKAIRINQTGKGGDTILTEKIEASDGDLNTDFAQYAPD